jgi:hypothetical protein
MIEAFLDDARTYCATRQIKLATLGRYACDDKALFTRLEAGGQCYPKTIDRVRAYMADHPPLTEHP